MKITLQEAKRRLQARWEHSGSLQRMLDRETYVNANLNHVAKHGLFGLFGDGKCYAPKCSCKLVQQGGR